MKIHHALISVCVPFLIILVGCSTTTSNFVDGVETEEQAATIVRALPEVQEYMQTLSEVGVKAEIDVQAEEGQWVVHVYELKDGHTATFNWFTVDRTSGAVSAMFP